MTIAYFDTIAGISGDMTLGALVSAGIPLETLITELGKLGISASRAQRYCRDLDRRPGR
jgi:uncharacterized protein (DUF111 family)